MGQVWLSGYILLHIHWNIITPINKSSKKFAKMIKKL